MAPSPHQRRPSSRVWLCPWQGAGTPNGGADGRGTGWWHHSRGSDMAGPPDWQGRTSTCTAVLFKTVNDTAEFKSRRRNVQSSRTKGGGFAHGLLGQTCLSAAWILSSGLQPAGESWVRVPPLSTAFSVSRWRGAPPPPNPLPQLGPGSPAHMAHADERPGGQEKPGCGQGLGARRPPSTPRGCWRLSHPCPKPSQRRRILATSKYPGSSWVDFPATHNTTRNGCRRDPRPGRPPPAPGEAKAQHGHGTGHRRAHALLAPNETASLHLHLNLRRTGCAFFRKFP